jgi:hypothetical protein
MLSLRNVSTIQMEKIGCKEVPIPLMLIFFQMISLNDASQSFLKALSKKVTSLKPIALPSKIFSPKNKLSKQEKMLGIS